MNASILLKTMGAMILLWGCLCMASPEEKSVTLPKGTTVEKIAPGHFRFKLPNKRIVEVRNFNPKTGVAGYVSLIDPEPPHKPVAAGRQVSLKTAKKITPKEAANLRPENYVQIDDEVTWLPATISFQPDAFGDPDPPLRGVEKGKVKGLSPIRRDGNRRGLLSLFWDPKRLAGDTLSPATQQKRRTA